ncbi:uncharacterized protein [Gossypium hirsutum]|uniref:RNase H type-1 domain-containing protein n=1 Tax=Gossypium hirsutum TaxID=3635 RepID=A0ABM2ZKD6_GOSHI|nr:uncharacterized protein LOC121213525 [Gossypium hirsutum]
MSGGTMYSELRAPRKKTAEEMLRNLSINAICEEEFEGGKKEHVQVLKKLFTRLRKFQLKLNPVKCTFGVRSGKLLGFVVSERGIEIDPDKVRAIQELPPPRTQKEVRDPLKYLMESAALNGRMARWQILLSEFDVVYVNQKAVKGSAIAEFLASRALDDYEPLNFDFPNKDLMYAATVKKDFQEGGPWKLSFDGASNAIGNGIGAVLVSPSGDYYPFTSKLDFDCTNNMAEYEACIMGIRAAIKRKIKVLEVYGDSALVIYQLKGEWETRDPKLMADALATLASMFKVNKLEDMKPIQISIYEAPAHCCNIDNEEGKDDHPWYHDILRYVKSREYPDHATENDKKTLRRLAIDYVLDGEILYKKGKD